MAHASDPYACEAQEEFFEENMDSRYCRSLQLGGFCCNRNSEVIQEILRARADDMRRRFEQASRPVVRYSAVVGDLTQELRGLNATDLDTILMDVFPEESGIRLRSLRQQFYREQHDARKKPVILWDLVRFVEDSLKGKKPNQRRATGRKRHSLRVINGIAGDALVNRLHDMVGAYRRDTDPGSATTAAAAAAAQDECAVCGESLVLYYCNNQAGSHGICHDCLAGYIRATMGGLVADARLVRCVDPGCNAFYPAQVVERVMGALELLRMQDRQYQRDRSLYGEMFECGCGFQASIDGLEQGTPYITCPGCEIRWCRQCNEMHPMDPARPPCRGAEGLCDNEIDRIGVRCPRCRAPLSRIDGCNHITCSVCQHDFCYICLDDWPTERQRPEFSHYRCNNPDPRFFGRQDRN